MGAMKRLLEDAYDELVKGKEFQLLGMDQQYHAAAELATSWMKKEEEETK
jgi:hypothetical protein